jgi:hypothetical protein
MVARPGATRPVVTRAGAPGTRDPDADLAGAATVTVTVYDGDGAEAGSREVTVDAGATVELPVADLVEDGAGTPVAVRVDRADDDASDTGVLWGVALTVDDGTGETGTLVSALAPTPATTAPGDVVVRSVDAG